MKKLMRQHRINNNNNSKYNSNSNNYSTSFSSTMYRLVPSLADRALSYTVRNPFRLKQMRSPTYEHDTEVDDATFMAAVQRFVG